VLERARREWLQRVVPDDGRQLLPAELQVRGGFLADRRVRPLQRRLLIEPLGRGDVTEGISFS